jgi:hypothetical protein
VPTEILRPNGAGDETNLSRNTGSNNWDMVDESSADGDSTYVYNDGTSFVYDSYALQDTALTDATAYVTDVRVTDRCRVSAGAGTGDEKINGIRLSSTNSMESAATTLTASYVDRQGTVETTKPGGGKWLAADLNNLQVRIGLRENGTAQARCTQLYVTVNYADMLTYSGGLTAGSQVSASSATTASISPVSGRDVILVVYSQRGSSSINQPTVSGAGLTWTNLQTHISSNLGGYWWRFTLFKGSGTPSAGALTISFGGQTQDDIAWRALQVADTYGVVQSAKATDNEFDASTLTVTLGAFANAGNYCLTLAAFPVIYVPAGDSNPRPESGHDIIDYVVDRDYGGLVATWALKTSEDTSVQWVGDSSQLGVVFALELDTVGSTPRRERATTFRGFNRGVLRGVA